MNDAPDESDATIQDLAARLFDDDLSEGGFRHLEQRLRDDPAARASYFDCVWLENSLADTLNPTRGVRQCRVVPEKRTSLKWIVGTIAAAAAIVLSLAYLHRGPQAAPEAAVRLCDNSQWTIDGSVNPDRSTLTPGTEFRLLQGVAELQLPYDVKAIVEAPARVSLVDDRSLRLDYGRSYFRVGKDGRGFTVVTPHQRIVDLGTEFGIDLQEDGSEVDLHVFKGRVRVDPPTGGDEGEITQAGRSVELGGSQVALELKHSGNPFLQTLPASVEIVFQDDFEIGLTEGQVANGKGFSQWQRTGSGGVYNPTGDGRWYDLEDLDDEGPSEGVAGGMKGPTMAFFDMAAPGSMARKELGAIAADSRYTVSMAIGVRAESPRGGEVFDGYTIRLKSGETTLAQLSSNVPPGPYSSCAFIGFSWDSSEMPPAVKAGDPVAIEIAPNRASGAERGYLDFDNVRVSVVGNP